MIGINSISKASPTMKFEIVNIVATADLRQQVELTEIAKIRFTIYDQEIYGGRVAYLKTPTMHGKTTIFPSGKLISVGTNTRKQAKHDLQETVDTLSQANLIKPMSVTANVRNIVALLTLPNPMPLERLEGPNLIYESEQFPAAVVKSNEPKATYLIFNSGKIIISGVKTEEELEKAAEAVTRIAAGAEKQPQDKA
jgi:transcription initiation factor TFIID TATA-box-binding protein